MTTCLNCGNTFEGEYCPHCGQKADTKRLKLLELLRNSIGPFVGGDSKFLRTCRGLLVRPGHMVREYLQGKRAPYYNPLQLYIFLLTIYAILTYTLNTGDIFLGDITNSDRKTGIDSGYAIVDYIFNRIDELNDNKLYGSILLASFAAPCFWKLLRKSKVVRLDSRQLPLNITEQFYALMYHSCTSMIISIVIIPLSLIKCISEFLVVAHAVCNISYLVVLYRQLYGIRWRKSIPICLIGMALTTIVLSAVTVFIALIAILIQLVTEGL